MIIIRIGGMDLVCVFFYLLIVDCLQDLYWGGSEQQRYWPSSRLGRLPLRWFAFCFCPFWIMLSRLLSQQRDVALLRVFSFHRFFRLDGTAAPVTATQMIWKRERSAEAERINRLGQEMWDLHLRGAELDDAMAKQQVSLSRYLCLGSFFLLTSYAGGSCQAGG